MDELKFAAVIIISVLIFSFAIHGVASLLGATRNAKVIEACKSSGFYNFGQTRIICRVEEKAK